MAKGLAVFLDIRDSTLIPTKDKIEKYRAFYKQFNTYDIEWSDNLELKYKSYAGDGILLFFKCGQLNVEVIELFDEIQRKVETVENNHDLEIGIGVGYGDYANEQIPMGKCNDTNYNVATPLSSYIDLACKASLIARKKSDYHFAININSSNSNIDFTTQLELVKLLSDYSSEWDIKSKKTSSKTSLRFDFNLDNQ